VKKWGGQAAAALLTICFAAAVFLMRDGMQPEKMNVPVTQVMQYVAPAAPSPEPLAVFRAQREQTRSQTSQALADLAQTGDEHAQNELTALIERTENELAIECALAALGHAQAVCAVREGAVVICLKEALTNAQAAAILELSENLTGECAENVFLLDECGYSW